MTTFEGSIKILDNVTFKTVWHNTNKERKPEFHATIATIDVDHVLGLMVTGGDLGKILLIDPFGMGLLQAKKGHNDSPIVSIFIYRQQQQIIAVTEDRTVLIMNAFTMEKIQVIRDHDSTLHSERYTGAEFDMESGKLWTSCY